jgi:hypothetical protein
MNTHSSVKWCTEKYARVFSRSGLSNITSYAVIFYAIFPVFSDAAGLLTGASEGRKITCLAR